MDANDLELKTDRQMKIELTADVVRVLEPQTFASGSQKVAVHLTWMEQGKDDKTFEQVIEVECWGSRVDTAMALNQGDTVKVDLYLSGREWRRDESSPWKAFNTLRVGKLETIVKAATGQPSIREQVIQKSKASAITNDQANDLPF